MSKDAETVTLLGISKEEVGEGWSPAYSLSEYEIPQHLFLKHCKRVSKTEPDVFNILLISMAKKARALLGL